MIFQMFRKDKELSRYIKAFKIDQILFIEKSII